MNKILKRALGDPQARTLKRYKKRVLQINALEEKYKAMTDQELIAQTEILRERIKKEKKNPLEIGRAHV